MRIVVILGVLLLLATVPVQAQTHQTVLNWSAPATGPAPTGYNVYRYATACPAQILISTATKLTTTATNALTYTDSTVTAGSTYCYFTTSVTASAESAASGTVQVTVPITTAQAAPNPPTFGSSTTVQ